MCGCCWRNVRWPPRSLAAHGAPGSSRRCSAPGFSPIAFVHFRETAPPQVPGRFQLMLPGEVRYLQMSPDGRNLAFVSSEGGQPRIWLRSLDALDARRIPGTEGGSFPFWSPDGENLGFFADGKLKKIAIAGGPAQVLCDAPLGGRLMEPRRRDSLRTRSLREFVSHFRRWRPDHATHNRRPYSRIHSGGQAVPVCIRRRRRRSGKPWDFCRLTGRNGARPHPARFVSRDLCSGDSRRAARPPVVPARGRLDGDAIRPRKTGRAEALSRSRRMCRRPGTSAMGNSPHPKTAFWRMCQITQPRMPL